MKHKSLSLGWAVLLVLLCTNVAAGQSRAPDIIASRHLSAEQPLWVSADAAVSDSAELRWDLFSEYERSALLEVVEEQTNRELERVSVSTDRVGPYLDWSLCTSYTVTFSRSDDPKPRDSWDLLRSHARGIFEGEVVAIDQGFYGGEPRALLTVAVEEYEQPFQRLNGPGAYTPAVVYIVYPYAVFQAADTVFCHKNPQYPYVPEIGDHLLAFPAHPFTDRHDTVLEVAPQELIFEHPPGKLFIPEDLRDETDLESVDSLSRLKSLIASKDRGRKPEEDQR